MFTILLSFAATAAGSQPDVATANPTGGPPDACRSHDARNIVVCGQRTQPYRLDPSIMDAERQAHNNSRSAMTSQPAAQSQCASSPMGCTKGLESLDVANVAVVVGTAAFRAAEGKDWARAFKTAGPDEYQLYRQAKRQRETEESERAAAKAKMEAEQVERERQRRK